MWILILAFAIVLLYTIGTWLEDSGYFYCERIELGYNCKGDKCECRKGKA